MEATGLLVVRDKTSPPGELLSQAQTGDTVCELGKGTNVLQARIPSVTVLVLSDLTRLP